MTAMNLQFEETWEFIHPKNPKKKAPWFVSNVLVSLVFRDMQRFVWDANNEISAHKEHYSALRYDYGHLLRRVVGRNIYLDSVARG